MRPLRGGLDFILKLFLFLAALTVSVWGLIEAKEFLVPIAFSALLAMLMIPIVKSLKRAKFPEWLSVTIATVVLFLPMLFMLSLVLIEADSLVRNWPAVSASAEKSFQSVLQMPLAQRFHAAEYLNFATLEEKATASAGAGAMFFFGALHEVLSASTQVILILSFAVLMLASRKHLRRSFEMILAVEASPERAVMLDGALGVLEKFLVARVAMIVFVALADFVILKLFGLPYAVILALILGLSTLLPVVGFFGGAVLPVIVAAAQGYSGAVIAGVFASLWAVSSVQDHFMTPKLIGKKLNLNFLATVVAVFAGEKIWGLSGMFLSIPALGLLRVLLSASDALHPWALLLQEEEGEEKVKKALLVSEQA